MLIDIVICFAVQPQAPQSKASVPKQSKRLRSVVAFFKQDTVLLKEWIARRTHRQRENVSISMRSELKCITRRQEGTREGVIYKTSWQENLQLDL